MAHKKKKFIIRKIKNPSIQMGTYLIIGSGEGQLDCGKVEESHSEINPGARHDCNGKYIR
jgi:hypothetical protein